MRVGDVVRAVSAAVPVMKYPAGNLLMGGIGRPGFKSLLVQVSGHEFKSRSSSREL